MTINDQYSGDVIIGDDVPVEDAVHVIAERVGALSACATLKVDCAGAWTFTWDKAAQDQALMRGGMYGPRDVVPEVILTVNLAVFAGERGTHHNGRSNRHGSQSFLGSSRSCHGQECSQQCRFS